MNIDYAINSAIEEIRAKARVVRWLRKNAEKLRDLPDGVAWGSQFDFNNLSHADTIKVIRALGGRWQKEPNAITGTVDYSATLECGIRVRSWASAPPPSCRLVEVEELVPEQVIPAHVKKVTKMICQSQSEPVAVAVAFAKEPTTTEEPK